MLRIHCIINRLRIKHKTKPINNLKQILLIETGKKNSVKIQLHMEKKGKSGAIIMLCTMEPSLSKGKQ